MDFRIADTFTDNRARIDPQQSLIYQSEDDSICIDMICYVKTLWLNERPPKIEFRLLGFSRTKPHK